jgi:septum site-determining protein MinC
MPDSSLVQIKGLRDGLLVTLGDGEWVVLFSSLMTQIDAKTDFFKGAKLALDVGSQTLHVAEMTDLRNALSDREIILWAVLSTSATTENTAQMLGLATRLSKVRPDVPVQARPDSAEDSAMWVKRTVRSGVRLEYEGNVVVLGDVNPGAEIVAGGSILVWGRLRGVVHAGAAGDTDAVVCALDLSPTQLRIAAEIATTPERRNQPMPEMVRLIDGQLVAEPWQPGQA